MNVFPGTLIRYSDPIRIAWVAMLAVLMATGCGQEGEIVTSATSKYEVAPGDEPADNSPPTLATPSSTRSDSTSETVTTQSPSSFTVAIRPTETSSAIAPPEKPSSEPPPGVNATAPAARSSADLMRYLKELQSREPVGTSQAAALADFQLLQQEIVATADTVLRMATTEATQVKAVDAKLGALTTMMQMNVQGASDMILQFCDELRSNELPSLVDRGNSVGIQMRMFAMMNGLLRDPEQLVDAYRHQLSVQEKGESLLQLGHQVATVLEQKDFPESALLVLHETTAAFNEVGDPQFVSSVGALSEEAELIAADARNKFMAVVKGEPGAEEELIATARTLLANDRKGPTTAEFLLGDVAFTLESNLMGDVAARIMSEIGQAYAGHSDAQLASNVRDKVQRFGLRSALMGQPFVVEGIDLNGRPLDWSQYAGKVVLVNFWATGFEPCIQELPNIQANYERFRSQGFDVIGVNLDEDMRNVSSFFSVQQLPWTTVVSADPEARGMQTPLAQKCGVEFIPFMVLVGRDGRVAALNVRGNNLGPRVAELLAATRPPTRGG